MKAAASDESVIVLCAPSGRVGLPTRDFAVEGGNRSQEDRAREEPDRHGDDDRAREEGEPEPRVAVVRRVHVVQIAQRAGREDEDHVHDHERDEEEHRREVNGARELDRIDAIEPRRVFRPCSRHAQSRDDRSPESLVDWGEFRKWAAHRWPASTIVVPIAAPGSRAPQRHFRLGGTDSD